MDTYGAIMLGGTALLIVGLLLVGRFHPRSGAEILGWSPTRSPELEAENELDDLAQMLDAANERRRARGEPERTLEDVELDVMAEQRARDARRTDLEAERDAEGLRDAVRAARARRRP